MILAAAGLKRLGFTDRVTEYLSTDLSIPAIGQGALGIECCLDNEAVKEATAKAAETSEQFRPYSLMKRDVEAQRMDRDQLVKRLNLEEAELKQLADSVRVINYAKVGQDPVSPNKPLNMALGIIVGLIVGIGRPVSRRPFGQHDSVVRLLGAFLLALVLEDRNRHFTQTAQIERAGQKCTNALLLVAPKRAHLLR